MLKTNLFPLIISKLYRYVAKSFFFILWNFEPNCVDMLCFIGISIRQDRGLKNRNKWFCIKLDAMLSLSTFIKCCYYVNFAIYTVLILMTACVVCETWPSVGPSMFLCSYMLYDCFLCKTYSFLFFRLFWSYFCSCYFFFSIDMK